METGKDTAVDESDYWMRDYIDSKPAALVINGKRTLFRSRLEARWALFFDRRGLRWEYEPFKFPVDAKGVTYTPDFKVDGIGIIEIKPYFEALADSVERIEKYVEKTKERVYLFHGPSPFNAGVTILVDYPLKGYHCDEMQSFLIEAGKQAREFAASDYDTFRQSMVIALQSASAKEAEFDLLSVGEMMAFDGAMERSKEGEARGKTILRRIMMKQGKEHAA